MKQLQFLIIILLFSLNSKGQSTSGLVEGMERAASEGNISAQLYLGNCYFNGTLGCQKNLEKAKYYYRLAANQGDSEAEYNLSRVLRTIGFKTQDEEEIFLGHLRTSADKGYEPALYALGVELFDRNIPEAYKYLKMAFDKGDKNAIYPLGLCYLQGLGCSVDYNSAVTFLTNGKDKAEEINYLYNMGRCYIGLKDFNKALNYLNRSIELGSTDALLELAQMNAYGLGVTKDLSKAHEYLDKILDKEPRNYYIYDFKGRLYLEEGNFDKAHKMWDILIKANPNHANIDSDFIKTMKVKLNYSVSDKLHIEEFYLDETDISANLKESMVYDQNGDKCALIKLITPLKGLMFDNGVLGVAKAHE